MILLTHGSCAKGAYHVVGILQLLGKRHGLLDLGVQTCHELGAVVLLRILLEAHHSPRVVDFSIDVPRVDHPAAAMQSQGLAECGL